MISLNINNQATFGEIQDEFQEAFPYLRLHLIGRGTCCSDNSDEKECVLPTWENSIINIVPNMSIRQLIKTFEHILGLSVGLCRKAPNDIWLPLRKSDLWTLEELNNRSKELFDEN